MRILLKLLMINVIAFIPSALWGREISDLYLIQSRNELGDLSVVDQQSILKYLSHSGPYGRYLQTYWVSRDSPNLSFLDKSMIKKIYRWSQPKSSANCYFTSISSFTDSFTTERFMGLNEYFCHLQRHFRPLLAGENIEVGDVIRLQRARGKMDTHSVVYLGHIKDSPNSSVVLSKNGPMTGPYLIMNLWELQNKVYPSSQVVGVYRRDPSKSAPTDPARDPRHPCRSAMEQDR
jgi:hypothetical protein